MLYIADLKRNGLLKIGVAAWYRIDLRESELRRELRAPELSMFSKSVVPFGWGDETEWERRLIARMKNGCGSLQIFSSDEACSEVVDGTLNQALGALAELKKATEIDHRLDADQIVSAGEDWRFYDFWHKRRNYTEPYGAGHSMADWNVLWQRQLFINWLRGDEFARVPERLLDE